MTRRPLDSCTVPLRGLQVIEASAGTGKTYTITSLVARLVTEGRLAIEQVLAVTFTNAAAAELEGRIRQRVGRVRDAVRAGESSGDEVAAHLLALPERAEVLRRLDRAVRDVDRAAVTTIHGFCARALSEYALSAASRPDTTLLGDDRGVLYDVVTDFWSSHVASLPLADFRSLRGEALHADLARVAKGVVSAPGVPLDRHEEPCEEPDALARYSEHFAHACALFFEQGRSLLDVLLSDRGLNRNSYRTSTIERVFGALGTYFHAGEHNPRSYPDLEDGRFTAERVRKAAKSGHVPISHPLLDVLEEHLGLCRSVVLQADRKREELLRRLAAEIEARLQQEHGRLRTQSFDGLLRALDGALGGGASGADLAAAIRRRFPALLIDEFQDTDPVQYRVFRRIYLEGAAARGQETAVFFIGDPKQSIYRFRGADVSTYLAAAGQAAGVEGAARPTGMPERARGGVWTLGTNWRSGPLLVTAQNALFGGHPRPFGTSSIRYEAVRPAPGREDLLEDAHARRAPGLRIVRTAGVDVTELAAAEVVRLLTSGFTLQGRPLSPRDIAVLTRTNAQAEEVQAALRQVGVPAVMHGDRSVFEAPEARELRRILRAWVEPGQRALVHAALATRLVGRTADELARLGTDADAFEREMEGIRRQATAWRHRGIAVALETLFTEVDLLARTLADVDGERRMTNFRHLLELLHQAEVERHLGVVGLLRFLETAIAAPTGHDMAAEARQVRLESDDDAVTLTTVHKSKGLEYGVVLLPQIGRAEGRGFPSPVARYHDPQREGREFLHIGDDDAPHELAKQEDREEALRLGYVGLTRAQHQVVAFIEDDRGFSALGWFLHGGSLDGARLSAEAFKQLSDEGIERAYAALSDRAGGAISVEAATESALRVAPFERSGRSAVLLTPPPIVAAPTTERRTSSFSAMTRARAPLSRAEREGKDVDRLRLAAAETPEPVSAFDDAIAMDGFPRGAGPGDALHAMLERLPFGHGSEDTRLPIIEDVLSRRGFERAFAPGLERCLSAALEVPLTPEGIRLCDLAPRDCARELEFSLPVRGASRGLLSARELSRCLMAHAGAKDDEGRFLSREYAASLGGLEFQDFEGFLRGFLDLAFWKEGRAFVADYKSNHLGPRYADYDRLRLQAVMESHHYLLQGLLYAVATHRYFGARLPGYRYEEHFGGITYLFLRGIDPAFPGNGRGVYFFRPSERLIEDLSGLLAGGTS